jgi:tRNA-Thr(GGU) m(6)t(6)A37 methyltransferase TsaA
MRFTRAFWHNHGVEVPRLRVIGKLESPFRQKFATPRQPNLVPAARAVLRLDPKLEPEHAFRGLEEFSHVWLLFWFHLNTNKKYSPVVHPPRLKGRTIGVFASRAPHRPNPVGLTLARLVRVEKDALHLSGVDLVDGTPILDVKPYVPQYDAVPEAKSGWIDRNEFTALEVKFELELEPELRDVIFQALSQDPRNPRDRAQRADGKKLYFLVGDVDVCFSIEGKTATVHSVERNSKRPPGR